jgi:hypothetical protein
MAVLVFVAVSSHHREAETGVYNASDTIRTFREKTKPPSSSRRLSTTNKRLSLFEPSATQLATPTPHPSVATPFDLYTSPPPRSLFLSWALTYIHITAPPAFRSTSYNSCLSSEQPTLYNLIFNISLIRQPTGAIPLSRRSFTFTNDR